MDKYDKIIESIQDQKKNLEALKVAAGSGKGKDVKAFEKEVSRLWALHFPSLPFFKNKFAALESLKEAGYKIGRDKFYVAAKNGELKVQEDGRVFHADLDSFILNSELKLKNETNLKKADVHAIEMKNQEFINIKNRNEKIEAELGILTDKWEPKQARDLKDIEKILEFRSACLAWEDRWPPLLEDLSAHEMKLVIHEEVFAMLNNFSIDGKFTVLDKLINCRACVYLEEKLIQGLKGVKSGKIPEVINKVVSEMLEGCSLNGKYDFMGND
ncbi:hypothetical protein KAR91_31210 [Candidatus Pacearchaeota archaeon]|nr:hypothetical protein [Candidatus Pacearchaeota archaeon]